MSFIIKVFSRIFVLRTIIARLTSDSEERTSSSTSSRPGGNGGIPSQTGEGSAPASPLDLEKPEWKATVKRTLKEIKKDRLTLVGAGMAYYFFLAIFPAFIALFGILNLMDINPNEIVKAVEGVLPKGAGDVLTDPLQRADELSQGTSLTAAVTGIALALWSASSGMVALQAGLNIAYDVGEDRKFIGKRGVGILLLLAAGVLGGVPSPLFTFGDSLPFTVLGSVLSLAAVIVLFSLFYYLGPNRKNPKWTWVSVGGIVGTMIWVLASVGFGFYVSEYGQYEKTYGPAAGMIVLILWLYLTSVFVLIGGELNAELERQGEKRKKGQAEPSI